jgi:predicted lipoprotein with Yx(FWY)xxD motif
MYEPGRGAGCSYAAVTAENQSMKRELMLFSGTASLLILAACGSATAGTSAGTPTAIATPIQTPTAAPTPTPTAVATPTPVPTQAPATGTAIMLRSVGNLGQILVGANGKTVYFFMGDTGMTSTCNGSCAQNWPPVTTTGTPRAVGGVSQALLGTTTRANGSMQVTYHGHPLYYFIADTGPGMANGEGLNAFGALWKVVTAAGMSR